MTAGGNGEQAHKKLLESKSMIAYNLWRRGCTSVRSRNIGYGCLEKTSGTVAAGSRCSAELEKNPSLSFSIALDLFQPFSQTG